MLQSGMKKGIQTPSTDMSREAIQTDSHWLKTSSQTIYKILI